MKTHTIQMRVTPEEHDQLSRLARKAKMTRSEFILSKTLKQPKQESRKG
jgi:uncharacterized protein (DUF1778 family)